MDEETYLRYRTAELEYETGNPTAAAKQLQDLLEEAPGNESLLELQARALLASRQHQRAETALRLLLEKRPDHAWAHYALSRALRRQGRDTEAETEKRVASALGFNPEGPARRA